MRVWRICRREHQALDGEGARRFGGRWNSEGVAAVYASSTLALAALELLVHVDVLDVPDDLVAMAIDVPDDVPIEQVAAAGTPAACVQLGDAWLAEGKTLGLRVPSAVVPEEWNFLINPVHPRAGEIAVASVRPFTFDPRLL